jgi:FHA domain.
MKLWCFTLSCCCCPSVLSLHFQERSLTLDQPVKIGRSVARARASPNNAIFDCKVLSRNHALLWYENGKVLNLIAVHVQKVIHVCTVTSAVPSYICFISYILCAHAHCIWRYCRLHWNIDFYLYLVQCYVLTKRDLCMWLRVSAETFQTNFCIDIHQLSKSK